MTTQEFSNEFDVLYNNIMSNQAPGLNEYEKSVFLTKAQDELIKNYFNPKSNPKQDGFDDTIKRQSDFSSLIFSKKLSPVTVSSYPKIHPGSSVFRLDSEILLVINESIKLSSGELLSVIPVTYTELSNLLLKPYKYPPKSQVWRYLSNIPSEGTSGSSIEYDDYITVSTLTKGLPADSSTIKEGVVANTEIILYDLQNNIIGKKREYISSINKENNTYVHQIQTAKRKSAFKTGELISEVVTAYSTTSCDYIIRYIKRPRPIILTNLEDNYSGLSIMGYTDVVECELDASLHLEILQRAVELAKAAYIGDLNSTVELGQRSE